MPARGTAAGAIADRSGPASTSIPAAAERRRNAIATRRREAGGRLLRLRRRAAVCRLRAAVSWSRRGCNAGRGS